VVARDGVEAQHGQERPVRREEALVPAGRVGGRVHDVAREHHELRRDGLGGDRARERLLGAAARAAVGERHEAHRVRVRSAERELDLAARRGQRAAAE
jgi:hypothetical protein